MDMKKRNYTVSIKATKNFQSVSLTEGFEVDVDEKFNEVQFNAEKEQLKERLIKETRLFIQDFVSERKTDDDVEDIDVDIAEDY